MSDFFAWLAGWLDGLLTWLVTFVKTIFLVLWDFLKDLFCWFFDQLLSVVVDLLGAISFNPATFSPQTYLSGAPAEVLSMLVAIQLPACMAMIAVALAIRFGLQLIPFVRLGS